MARRLKTLLACAALVGAGAQPGLAASDSVIVVVSAARGMTAKFKGGQKFTALRAGLLKSLGDLPIDTTAGLIAFGETPAKACGDVSDLTPPAPLSTGRAALTNALNKVRPRQGRSPQIAAISRAAELLKNEPLEASKSVVLIAATADDCAEDPCAAAKAFSILNPNLAVHVIALAPAKTDKARLQCIGVNTGGSYDEAPDTASVQPLITAALRTKIAPGQAEAAPPQPAPSTQAFPAPPLPERNPGAQTAALPVKPEPNVTLKAVLAAGEPALQQGVAWRIFPAKAGAKGDADYEDVKPVWSGSGAEPRATLAPGRYYVQAAYGFVKRGADYQVDAGAPLEAVVQLDAGTIEARAFAKPGAAPLDQMFYILYTDNGGPAQEIGRSSRSDAVFHTPAGRYRLVGQHGYAEAEAKVSVDAGKTARVDLVIDSGALKIETLAQPGGAKLNQVFYYIFTADAEAREVARSAAAEPVFRLASGAYRIVAQYDLAKAEKQVSVVPGQTTNAQLIMDGASVKLTAKLAGREGPLSKDIRYTLYKLNNGAVETSEEVGRYASVGREVYLRSGRYRIESKYGYQNAVQAAEVSVNAGENRSVVIEHRAGEIKLALVPKPGGAPLARVRWTVADDAGAVVLTTSQSLPEMVLKSGAYVATAQHAGKTYSAPFDVADNDVKTVEVEAK